MIPLTSSDDARAVLCAHLESLLGGVVNAAAAEGVATAVIQYLADQRLAPPLPDDYLHLLGYRALCALHQRDAARRWAAAQLPGIELPVFDPAIWPGPVPLIVWQLFASGLVRPSRTVTAGGRLLWALDFRRLRKEQAGWMEITLLPGLRALLEQLAPALDETSGAGILGLRGLYAAGFAPTPRRRRKIKSHSAFAPLDAPALRAFCLRVLAHLQTARGWQQTPAVLYLDFPHKG